MTFSLPPATSRGLGAFAMLWLLGVMLLYSTQATANPRYASIVIDVESGRILHADHADASRYPASLTKMMTLYLLFEALEDETLTLEDTFPVSKHAAAQPASKLWVKPGSRLSVEEAILALIVRSANDVAVVVAEGLAGSEPAFAEQMTDKAWALGMSATTFRNASGLPDDAQITTARDMATLSMRLMQDFPQYYGYFSRTHFVYRGKTHTGHNRLLDNYAGADGLKTGYIRASGFNVATSAVRNDRRIVSVVMGGASAKSRDAHMAELLDSGFARTRMLGHGDWVAKADVFAGEGTAASAPPKSKGTGTALAVAKTSTVSGATVSPDEAVIDQQGRDAADDPIRTLIAARGERVDALAGGAWAVQVGAFSNRAGAQSRASQAADYLATELGEAQVSVIPAKGAQTLYRARLVDLQESQARRSCQQLARQGMDCVVVRAGVGG